MNDSLVAWTSRFDRLPVVLRLSIVGLAVVTVVALDLVTGPDLTLTFSYALCAMAAAWFVDRRWGLVVAAIVTAAGFLVDAFAEHDEDWTVAFANHALRAGSIVLFTLLAATARMSLAGLLASSRRDAMTGALSKHGFIEELSVVRRRAERTGAPVGVVYFDLDDLKLVNDRDGHAAGDALILRFVDRVSRHLRSSDPFGRLGGDEFAVVLERADQDSIDAIVGRVLADPGLPAVSCGVQVFEGHYPEPRAMLAGADRRMYQDKRLRRGTGRPRV